MGASETKAGLHLQLFGEVELRSSEGTVVPLNPRMVAGLLALLAMNRANGVSRNDLARSLWPSNCLVNQRNNLRQALFRLKEILGPDAVVSTRDWCRLSAHFLLDTDLDHLSAELKPDRNAFMPGFSEPCFESYRSSLDPSLVKEGLARGRKPEAGGPLEAFVQLVQWYAGFDPHRALELLRSNLDLSFGIASDVLSTITAKIEANLSRPTPHSPWLFYWQGSLLLQRHNLTACLPPLRRAFSLAAELDDVELQVESGLLLGVVEILQGRLKTAEQIALRLTSLCKPNGPALLRARVLNLEGSLLMHRGLTAEGFDKLRAAAVLYEHSPFDHHQMNALRAFYHATLGQLDMAVALLEYPELMALQTNHWRLDVLCKLARGVVISKTESTDDACKMLNGLVTVARNTDNLHVEIYARETLASKMWQSKEQPETAANLKASVLLRKKLNMSYTWWDRERLSAFSFN